MSFVMLSVSKPCINKCKDHNIWICHVSLSPTLTLHFLKSLAGKTTLSLLSLQPSDCAIKEVQPVKAYSSILVIELLILTSVRALQLAKASAPMLVTESGISTPVNDLQPEKAAYPMLVTESGISTCVRELQ